jgi:hypothetical protein
MGPYLQPLDGHRMIGNNFCQHLTAPAHQL